MTMFSMGKKSDRDSEMNKEVMASTRKEGSLAEKYRNLIANAEWHSWSMPAEEREKIEDEARVLGVPLTVMDLLQEKHRENVEIVQRLAGLVLGEEKLVGSEPKGWEEITEMVKEMAEMILAEGQAELSGERMPFQVNQVRINQVRINQVKKIGAKLNELGGFELMLAIATNYVPLCDRHELELLWQGIGDWKA